MITDDFYKTPPISIYFFINLKNICKIKACLICNKAVLFKIVFSILIRFTVRAVRASLINMA